MLKELISHIRAVYFALLVLCLVAISAAPDQTRADLFAAFDDAQLIQAILENPENTIQVDVREFFDSNNTLEGPSAANYLTRLTTAWNGVMRVASDDILDGTVFPNPWLVCGWDDGKCKALFTFPRETTIDDFRSFINRAYIIAPRQDWKTPRFTRKQVRFPPNWQEHRPEALKCSFEATPGGIHSGPGQKSPVFLTTTTVACIANSETAEWVTEYDFPVNTSEYSGANRVIDVPLREVLSGNRRAWAEIPNDAGVDTFSQSFPSLTAVLKDLPKLPALDVVSTLKARAVSEPQRIDAFGAKLPLTTVLVAIAILLFGCQFYLWVHIKELQTVLRRAEQTVDFPTPFLGLYQNTIANWAFTISITILPLGALSFTLSRFVPRESWKSLSPAWGACALSAMLSTLIGIRSALLMEGIRKMQHTETLRAKIPERVPPSNEIDCQKSSEKLKPDDRAASRDET